MLSNRNAVCNTSVKWECYPEFLPMWIAESDLGTSAKVENAILESVLRGEFGYAPRKAFNDLYLAFAEWFDERYGFPISSDSYYTVPDVMSAYEITLKILNPGDRVVVPTPAYYPFLKIPARNSIEVSELPMLDVGGRWLIDLEMLEYFFRFKRAKLLVLCDPHNPTGSVMRHDELEKIFDIVSRYGGIVFNDLVHAPISNVQIVPYASLDRLAFENSVTAFSISKGWNVSGLKCAQVFSNVPSFHGIMGEIKHRVENGASRQGIAASIAGYQDNSGWIDTFNTKINNNRDIILASFEELQDTVFKTLSASKATYFAWLDFSGLSINPYEELLNYQLKTTAGFEMGSEYFSYVRVNLAALDSILKDGIFILGEYLKSLVK